MSFDFSFGGIHLGRGARTRASEDSERVPDREPARIGILADFGGKPEADGSWPVVRVDRDRFAEVMERRGISLRLILPAVQEPLELRFRSLDDFHPDRLMDQVPWLSELKRTRQDLRDPATFALAAERLNGNASRAAEVPVPAMPMSSAPLAEQDPQALLDQILSQPPSSRSETGDDPWGGFLQSLTAPYLVAQADPREPELVESVEAALSDLLRQILHHPEFQALEANWRALWWLVRGVETGASLVVDLIDVPRSVLEADVISTQDLTASRAFSQLVKPIRDQLDGPCWTLLAGAFTIQPTLPDLVLLWRLGQLARSVSARFVLEGSPRLAGCRGLASTSDPDDWSFDLPADVLEAWTDLRASEDADFLALALPSWVARWPYGPDRDPIETFAFEESPDPLSDTALLWASPIFAVARILGESLTSDHGTWPDLEDAILVTHEVDGETVTRSPTRVPLGPGALERLLQGGLSPLVHETGTDRIRLPALVSLTEVPTPLFG